MIKSLGYSKYLTSSTKHMISEEAERMAEQITNRTCRSEEVINGIRVWLETASELNLLRPTCQMHCHLAPMTAFVASQPIHTLG
jgi:copper homeostasis protein CutC